MARYIVLNQIWKCHSLLRSQSLKHTRQYYTVQEDYQFTKTSAKELTRFLEQNNSIPVYKTDRYFKVRDKIGVGYVWVNFQVHPNYPTKLANIISNKTFCFRYRPTAIRRYSSIRHACWYFHWSCDGNYYLSTEKRYLRITEVNHLIYLSLPKCMYKTN